MNCITLIGYLGQDPDIKYFESGTNVAKFSIAVRRSPRNGEKQDTDWFTCECWSKMAEVVASYCHKGKQVAVQGRIEFDHWVDKTTGEKRSKPVVKIERLELLGSSNGAGKTEDEDETPKF